MGIIAHRGYSIKYPENTMIAFDEAYRIGAHAIEFDIQLTSDSYWVVIHDDTVNRTTYEVGKVSSFKKDEIIQLPIRFHRNVGATIPSLVQVFEWARLNSLILHVEIKSLVESNQAFGDLVQLIHEYQLHHRVVISSFHPSNLKKVKALDAGIQIAPLFGGRSEDFFDIIDEVQPDGLHLSYKMLDKELMNKIRGINIPVRVYTVNDRAKILRALSLGVADIITDNPLLGLKVYREFETKKISVFD